VSTVEQPKYSTVLADGAIEARDYPALVVAEVTRRGNRGSAVRAGFSPLMGYIFAPNRPGDSVSMTAPVTQTQTPQADQKIAMTSLVTQAPAQPNDGDPANASWLALADHRRPWQCAGCLSCSCAGMRRRPGAS